MAEATASGLRHVAIEPAVEGNAFTYVRRLTAGVDPMSVAEQALLVRAGASRPRTTGS